MNTLLVTGANGTIGQHLTAELQRSGTAFETLSSRPGAGQRVASFDDAEALRRAFEGVRTLFVLLPLVPHKLAQAKNVAAAAKAAGVKHLVRSSGAGADPASPFALPRLQGQVDTLLAETGIATTFLRPAGFMQNYATFMKGQVDAGTLFLATADARQSLIDARDIAAAAAAVLREPAAHAGRAYTLTGGESLTDSERAAVLTHELGHPVQVQFIAPEAAVQVMQGMHFPAAIVEWMNSLNRLVAAGYAADISPDAATLLGRAPTSFAQFVREHRSAWA